MFLDRIVSSHSTMSFLSVSQISMSPSCGGLQRKRSRQQIPDERERQPSTKRRKAESVAYSRQFWDTLSTVTLTRRALAEFDRRRTAGAVHSTSVPVQPVARGRLLRSDTRRLQAFASCGGPDLSILRGVSKSKNVRCRNVLIFTAVFPSFHSGPQYEPIKHAIREPQAGLCFQYV